MKLPKELLDLILLYRRRMLFQKRIDRLEKKLRFPSRAYDNGITNVYMLPCLGPKRSIAMMWFPVYLEFSRWRLLGAYTKLYRFKMIVWRSVGTMHYEYEQIY